MPSLYKLRPVANTTPTHPPSGQCSGHTKYLALFICESCNQLLSHERKHDSRSSPPPQPHCMHMPDVVISKFRGQLSRVSASGSGREKTGRGCGVHVHVPTPKPEAKQPVILICDRCCPLCQDSTGRLYQQRGFNEVVVTITRASCRATTSVFSNAGLMQGGLLKQSDGEVKLSKGHIKVIGLLNP